MGRKKLFLTSNLFSNLPIPLFALSFAQSYRPYIRTLRVLVLFPTSLHHCYFILDVLFWIWFQCLNILLYRQSPAKLSYLTVCFAQSDFAFVYGDVYLLLFLRILRIHCFNISYFRKL